MSFLKALGWVAGGVAAVVAAPVTGGGSLAVLIGAAGTTTAAGAVLGGLGGLAASKVVDAITDDSEEKLDAQRQQTREAEARAAAAQRSQARQAAAHARHLKQIEAKARSYIASKEAEIHSLRQSAEFAMRPRETGLLVKAAAVVAASNGAIDDDEKQCTVEAIALLCGNKDEAQVLVDKHFAAPPTMQALTKSINAVTNEMQIKRLAFVLDAVAMVDEEVCEAEQQVIDVVHARMRDLGIEA